MPQRIKLYALSTCPACRKTRALLDSMGIAYDCTEVDTLEGSSQWSATNEMKKYNPGLTFPTLIVGDRIIVGYDEQGIREALK